MKYIFVINKSAGQVGSERALLEQLIDTEDVDYKIYYTTGPSDATKYVDKVCRENPDKQLCFVGCGGDGTLNEVASGLFGHENACMSAFPCGSGNDYVKYFGGIKGFMNINNIFNGTIQEVDVMEVNGRFSINAINVGLEASIAKKIKNVKRKPIIGGKNAYTTAIIGSIFTSLYNKATILVDGVDINPTHEYVICSMANGSHVGGSYNCAPNSLIDDGLIEVCLAKKMPLLKVVPMINEYKNGTHLTSEKCKDVIVYTQGEKIEIFTEKMTDLCIDGENIMDKKFTILNHKKAIKFVNANNVKNGSFEKVNSSLKE